MLSSSGRAIGMSCVRDLVAVCRNRDESDANS